MFIQCCSAEALGALCKLLCHRKVNGGWERIKSLLQACQGCSEDSLEILMLSIWQHKLMLYKSLCVYSSLAVPQQLLGCTLCSNTRWVLLGYVLPLTALPKIKLCCLQQDIGEILKFFNIVVTLMSKIHTNTWTLKVWKNGRFPTCHTSACSLHRWERVWEGQWQGQPRGHKYILHLDTMGTIARATCFLPH